MSVPGRVGGGSGRAFTSDGAFWAAWEIRNKVYVPSMIYHQGHLYAVEDDGLALCVKFDIGKLRDCT